MLILFYFFFFFDAKLVTLSIWVFFLFKLQKVRELNYKHHWSSGQNQA